MKEECAAGILSPFYDLEAVNRGVVAAALSVNSPSAESDHECVSKLLNRAH